MKRIVLLPVLFLLAITYHVKGQTVTISGTITDGTEPIPNVAVQLAGTSTQTIQTDSNGNYSFAVTVGGDFSITPSKAGYFFDPTDESVTGIVTDEIFNFTGYPDEIEVTGTITYNNNSLFDVPVIYSVNGGTADTIYTTATGYSLLTLRSTPTEITPILENCSFSPATVNTVQGFSGDTAINFVASFDTVTIYGTIRDDLGHNIDNVLVRVEYCVSNLEFIDSAYTNSIGEYELELLKGADAFVTISKDLFTFDQDYEELPSLAENTVLNFTGYHDPIYIGGIIMNNVGDTLSDWGQVGVIISGASTADTITTEYGYYSYEAHWMESYAISVSNKELGYETASLTTTVTSLKQDTAINFILSELLTPTIKFPANGAENVYPRPALAFNQDFSLWADISYHIMLEKNGITIMDSTARSSICHGGMQIDELEYGARYTWRVRVEYKGEVSNWTDTYSFTVANYEEDLNIVAEDTAELGNRIPLILIHGWNNNGLPPSPAAECWDNFLSYFNNDPDLGNNYKVYRTYYFSNVLPVNGLAQGLADNLEELNLSGQKIAIVGYGMGGLIARSFMNEVTFTNGIKCGENVKVLITLATPNHGTPMVYSNNECINYPGFDVEVEWYSFSPVIYVNRGNLLWDNYDNLVSAGYYATFPNSWLVALNGYTNYDPVTICYAGQIPGSYIENASTLTNQYTTSAYAMQRDAGMASDGYIPYTSATLSDHTLRAIRTFDGYNHSQMVEGILAQDTLFKQVKNDLLSISPLLITYPTQSGITFKHSTTCSIKWYAPDIVSKVRLLVSYNNGTTWDTMQSGITASLKNYDWPVPDTNTTQVKIRLEEDSVTPSSEPSESRYPFTIYHENIQFLSSLSNFYERGKTANITWVHRGVGEKVKITYSDATNSYTEELASSFEMISDTSTFVWNINSNLNPTDSAKIIIEILGMDQGYGDTENYQFTSEPLIILSEPSITVIAPNSNSIDEFGFSGEKLHVDSIYTIKWSTKGFLSWESIYLCDSGKNVIDTIMAVPTIPSVGSVKQYEWLVPKLYGNNFYLKIDGGPSADSTSALAFSNYSFCINQLPVVSYPAKTDSTVALYPCIQIQDFEGATDYNITISNTDANTSYSRYFTGSTSTICIPEILENELQPNVTYTMTLQVNSENIPSYGLTQKFTTQSVAPEDDFGIISPLPGELASDSISLKWTHSAGATHYSVDISEGKNTVFSKTGLSRTDTVTTFIFPDNAEYSDTLFWTVTAQNGFGSQTKSGYFFMIQNSPQVEFYQVVADSWERTDSLKFETTGNYQITLKDEYGGIGRAIAVNDGYLLIDKQTDKVLEARGTVNFVTSEGEYEPIFSGDFHLDSIYLYPDSHEVLIRKSFVPSLDSTYMSVSKWRLNNYTVYLSYSHTFAPRYPGISGGDDNDLELRVSSFFINNSGEIYGDIDDFNVSVGPMNFSLSDIDLMQTRAGDLYAKAKNCKMVLADNDFFRFGVTAGYGAYFGVKLNGDSIGFIGFKDNFPQWDNVIAFPDISIGNTTLLAPYANLKYFMDEEKWGIDATAMLIIPWIKKPTKSSIKGYLGSAASIPYIQAQFQFLDTAPHIKLIDVAGKNLSDILGQTGVYQISSFGGIYQTLAYSDGSFKKFSLSGNIGVKFGPEIWGYKILTASGTADFTRVKNNSGSSATENFSISGNMKLLGYISLTEAKLLISSKQSSNYFDIYVNTNASVGFPASTGDDAKTISGNLDGQMLYYYKTKDNGDITTGVDFGIKGKLDFTLKKGLVSFKDIIEWPSKDIVLGNVSALVGKIRREDKSNESYGFAFNYKKNFKIGPIEYSETIGFFQPAKGSAKCGFNSYVLADFDRSKSLRMKQAGMKQKAIKLFVVKDSKDEVVITIAKTDNQFIDFAITYEGNALPVMNIISPSGQQFSSEDYIANNPDLVGTNGFLITLLNEAGDWSFVVKNGPEVENYAIKSSVNPVAYNFSYNNVSVNPTEGALQLDCSYADVANDSTEVYFYYTPNNTVPGVLLNTTPFSFANGALSASFDISQIAAGNYTIYARLDDGSNLPQEFPYANPVDFSYTRNLLPPGQFNVIRSTDYLNVEWNETAGTSSYNVLMGSSPGVYSQQVSVSEPYIAIAQNDTLPDIYMAVKSVSSDGVESVASDEQYISLNAIVIDSVAPATPTAPTVATNLTGDESNSFAAIQWNSTGDAKGHILYLRNVNDSASIGLDVGNKISVKYYGLEVGQSFYVSVQAYDSALNYSGISSETLLNFFNPSDTDVDGMVDDKEILYFGSIGVTNDIDGDKDGDGITNGTELANGTNPNDTDTDDDRVWDDVDIHPLSAHDYDNDMMADDWEVYYNVSDPNDDPDQDSLVNHLEYMHRTVPIDADTDNGGMLDGPEVEAGLNPNFAADDLDETNRIIAAIDYIEATHKGNTVLLGWQTRDEDLLAGFNVYHRFSSDDAWRKVNEELISRPDTLLTAHQYSYTDPKVDSIVTIYYMIRGLSVGTRQEDMAFVTAQLNTSEIPTDDLNEGNFTGYPNPFTGKITLSFNMPPASQNHSMKLNIYDVTGQLVVSNVYQNLIPGNQQVEVNIPTTEKNMLYLFVMDIDGKISSRKFIRIGK
ncbi:MAG: T9SS type A sorting domain-containing protein [Bacteroidales bacterium]